MKFRDYQLKIISQGTEILKKHRFVYLAMEVRTGKTLTSLGIAEKLGVQNVLFITKKKAISSVDNDYLLLSPNFSMFAVNYESLHKLPDFEWDFVVLDEAHTLGAFPKPSKRAKQVRDIITKFNPFVCLLSGTPTPESYSQMYHQVYGIPRNPFHKYKNFYRFCDDYVNKVQRQINGFMVNDYSGGKQSINDAMEPYKISYTQQQAGFESEIEEEILIVPVNTKGICNQLKKDLVVEMDDGEVILADTGVKLMSKLHQMYSGTVKFESGKSVVLDTSKADFIKWKFNSDKIAIFYKFKAELDALKQVFGDRLCTDLETFNTTDKNIALQIVSGREGISLRFAEYIVFYNIDFSATSYWQARDRMTTKDRKYNKVYWLFSDGGIEKKVYKAVIQKKDYTLRHFKNDISGKEVRQGRL
jgi:SNF2 family DNA or RNA helicase